MNAALLSNIRSCIKKGLVIISTLILFILKDQSRVPMWSDYRHIIQWAIISLSLFLIVFMVQSCNFKEKINLNVIIVLLITINLTSFILQEALFIKTKFSVLLNRNHIIEEIGNHIIVGYHYHSELESLVQKNAIAGIYITRRNLEPSGLNLHNQIQQLQRIRFEKKLPQIWVSTDQEGGEISHLSPPLTQQKSLSKVVENVTDKKKLQDLVKSYASLQGKELSKLGVNLNLSPVVDIKNTCKGNSKRNSSSFCDRSISRNEKVIAVVALSYCRTLLKYKIYCTIKHFPGLNKVEEDTHISNAKLDTPISNLEAKDWIPFRVLMDKSDAFVMLGHVILSEVDQDYPVSVSNKVVTGLIRRKWNYEGILITDDFGMKPIYSQIGIGKAAIEALNSGVDLLLLSSDPDMYYPVMFELLHAYKVGKLDVKQLEHSRERLEHFQLSTQ